MLKKIYKNITRQPKNKAICIDDKHYTFEELFLKVITITKAIRNKNLPKQSKIAVVTGNNLTTYASILACWFNEMIYVPISLNNSAIRNKIILEQVNPDAYINTLGNELAVLSAYNELKFEDNKEAQEIANLHFDIEEKEDNILYVLFTSGSTGNPKGVPISLKNVQSFLKHFDTYEINAESKVFQPFDFTFDMSLFSILTAWYFGGCLYPVSQKGIKYIEGIKIIQQHQVDVLIMVPSFIELLAPYFSKINWPFVKYSFFAGEGLQLSTVEKWEKCLPNAQIENQYGPTEATITCLGYPIGKNIKAYNGLVCIGKPFDGTEVKIWVDNNPVDEPNQKGELLISGAQLFNGYIDNANNQGKFLTLEGKHYYKTGDVVFKDEAGDFYFCGRTDDQVQLQGYRVEINEVATYIQRLTNQPFAVIPYEVNNLCQLALFVCNLTPEETELLEKQIKENLPAYMIPSKIVSIKEIPLTLSGKTDKKALLNLL